MAHDWSEDDRSQVATLLRAGLSASHIAGQFPDASRNAIIGLVHRSKTLMAVGFARSPRNKPKPPKKVKMHRPENRFAALVKPRLVNRKPDDEPRRRPRPKSPVWPAEPRLIPMVEISTCQCRWPMWDDHGAPDFLMCGADTAIEQSYCAGHAAKVFDRRNGDV